MYIFTFEKHLSIFPQGTCAFRACARVAGVYLSASHSHAAKGSWRGDKKTVPRDAHSLPLRDVSGVCALLVGGRWCWGER